LKLKKLKIFDIPVTNLSSKELLSLISKAIEEKTKIKITYANAHTFNESKTDSRLNDIFYKFDIIHPDGIGVYIASRFLFGKKGFKEKIVGSDYYYQLINEGIRKDWKFYFFGHDNLTLEKIKTKYPELNIVGFNEGYSYESVNVVASINTSKPDILIVGLSFPIQESWIINNYNKIDFNVILAVGDGIKIFAGTKFRGPKIIRIIGLEWLMRLLHEPTRLWRRYLLGIPIFIFNVIKLKVKLMSKKANA
jgi:N-acetylglucosaminyldiphosphoundecaprenol N-acetyl-beta-D-mannosaminyltransferase